MCVETSRKRPRSVLGAGILKDRSLNSTTMTTAVQPSELVFEFASNGMDEINQVNRTPLMSLNTCTVRYKATPECSVPSFLVRGTAEHTDSL